MRTLLLLIALLVLPLSAEKVSFDKDRFSIEFPDDWKAAESPQESVIVHRESADGAAAFSISRLEIAKGARPDLEATLASFVENFKKGGMTVKGEPKGQESVIDGKPALVASVPVEVVHGEEAIPVTFFIVLIEATERLVVLQATLSDGGTNEERAACRKIIGSFEEKMPEEDAEKEEEPEKKDEKPDKPADAE